MAGLFLKFYLKIPERSRWEESKNRPPMLFCLKFSFSLISAVFCFASRPEEKQLFQFCLGFQWLFCVQPPILIPPWSERIEQFSYRCPYTFLCLSPVLWTVFSILSLGFLFPLLSMLKGHEFSHYVLYYCQAMLLHSTWSDLTQLWLVWPAWVDKLSIRIQSLRNVKGKN